MKKHFPGHFSPTKSEIELLWKNCIFVVDTNILLNLYRYSDATRKEFLRILDNIKERLWLPHRAAEEYFIKRLAVVSGQEKSYNDTLKTIKTLENDFKSTRQHPFISEKLMKRLTGIFDEVSKELEKNKETLSKRLREDEIQEELRKIFDGRVGGPFTEAEIEEICKDGERRYPKKIPPGFKDAGKTEEESVGIDHRKFGDLIIWYQILKMSAEQKKGIILVIDDKKEDWWYKNTKGETLGPRPELIKEFFDETKNQFYMYQSGLFLELAVKHLKQDIKTESVDEIRELSNLDSIDRRKMKLSAERNFLKKRISSVNDALNFLKLEQRDLERDRAILERPDLDGFKSRKFENKSRMLTLNIERQQGFMEELNRLMEEYNNLSKQTKLDEIVDLFQNPVGCC